MGGDVKVLVGGSRAMEWWQGQPVWYGAVPATVADLSDGGTLFIELPQTVEQRQQGCPGQQIIVPVADVRPRILTPSF